jgi:hypothetical protein
MQTKTSILVALGVALLFSAVAHAQLNIPSDGSDGAFSPNANVEIDLGLAANGAWTAPGGGNGVYDASKWAVVFKYSSVNIPNGVKVTFKNHPSYAPVVWLVQGNVTIAGELNLDGKVGTGDTVAKLTPTEPGPGGYRGGADGPLGKGAGMGPGGGSDTGYYAGSYGNPQIIPLIGGSGGGFGGMSGGSGGGAILVAASSTVTVSGVISANGISQDWYWWMRGGSGGAIRLIGSSVLGNGVISAMGTQGVGRIRIEAFTSSALLRISPETIAVPPAPTPILWPAENAPTARVVSVDAINAPTDPHAPLVAAADVAIQNSNPVNIVIETKNFPIEGVVQLFITQKFGGRTTLNATRLSGDITSAIWNVQTTLPQGFVTLQTRATQP